MRRSRFVRLALALALLISVFATVPAVADHTDAPVGVALVGSLQSELGCAGDWDPACPDTELDYDANDEVWQAVFDLPAGDWEYKIALNDSWDENYGAGGVSNGANIAPPPGGRHLREVLLLARHPLGDRRPDLRVSSPRPAPSRPHSDVQPIGIPPASAPGSRTPTETGPTR